MNEYRGQYKGETNKKVNIKWQCDLGIKYIFFKQHSLSKSSAIKCTHIISSEIILGHWKEKIETLLEKSVLRSTYTAYKGRIQKKVFHGAIAKLPYKAGMEIKYWIYTARFWYLGAAGVASMRKAQRLLHVR